MYQVDNRNFVEASIKRVFIFKEVTIIFVESSDVETNRGLKWMWANDNINALNALYSSDNKKKVEPKG